MFSKHLNGTIEFLDFRPFDPAVEVRQLVVRLPPLNQEEKLAGSKRLGTERRRLEYQLGRACAAQLLAELGSPSLNVGIRCDRSPEWPVNYVGSITHTDVLVAVAVGRASDVSGLGIDAERVLSHDQIKHIENLCLLPDERQACMFHTKLTRAEAVTLVFSAKETLFKCLYPQVGRFFDFTEAHIDIAEASEGTIRTCLRNGLSPEFPSGFALTGSCRFALGHVFTSLSF